MESNEYWAFKKRSEQRWLGAFITALVCCNLLVLGPCDVGEHLYGKPEIENRKYGDSLDWDGTVPRRVGYRYDCTWDPCYY